MAELQVINAFLEPLQRTTTFFPTFLLQQILSPSYPLLVLALSSLSAS
jgi:hypothetical protein